MKSLNNIKRSNLKQVVILAAWLSIVAIALTTSNVSYAAQARIVGGVDVNTTQAPGIVSLLNRTSVENGISFRTAYLCVGTVIGTRWILTAAHCVPDYGPEDILVLMGSSNLDFPSTSPIGVTEVIMHEDFETTISGLTQPYDIALLRLESDALVSPVQLNTRPITENQRTFSAGWGPTVDGGTIQAQLKGVTLQKSADPRCIAIDFPGTYCVETTNENVAGTCYGDSGGPNYLLSGNTPTAIAGILSGSYDDCNGTVLLTDVAAFTDWIRINSSVVAPGFGNELQVPEEDNVVTLPANAPSAPLTLWPGGDNPTGHNPYYRWSRVSEATSYSLVIQDEASGMDVYTHTLSAADAKCAEVNTKCEFRNPELVFNGVNHWRVRSLINDTTSDWSAWRRFNTGTSLRPAIPVIVKPSGGQLSNNREYVWNAVPGATEYFMEVQDMQSFVIPVSERRSASYFGCAQGTGQCRVTWANYSVSGNNRWRIRAGNADTQGGWSDWSSFTAIGSSVVTSPENAPSAPLTLWPGGDNPTGQQPYYRWSRVSEATSYSLVIQDEVSGMDVYTHTLSANDAKCAEVNTKCEFRNPDLVFNGVNHWRVRSLISDATSDWSAWRRFDTGTP